jgi:Type II secretion system protein B
MSYILDALRRLEQDKERARRGQNPMEAVLVPDLEQAEKPGRRLFWWTGVAFVLIAVVFAAAYWIPRSAIVFSTPQVREETSSSPLQAHPLSESMAPTRLAAPESPFTRPPPPDRERFAPPGSGSAPSGPTVTPDSPVQVARQEIPAPPVPQTASQSIEAEEKRQAPAYDSPDTLSRIMDTPREARESEVIRDWQGEEIKVNAIAWTQNAKSRFAVVNLKTVREGDEVQGLSVVRIEEDGVVFEQGGTKYRVSLGKH